MTEAEWLTATDTQAMVEFLNGTVSERKLRLLACARSRSLWDLMTDVRCRSAVEVAERLADGQASEAERAAAFVASGVAANSDEFVDPEDDTVYLAAMAAAYAHNAVWDKAFVAAHSTAPSASSEISDAPDALPLQQLRDIFGNPFRPVAFDPAWLTPAVVALAEGIYADRAFDRLPRLADALHAAGCGDAAVLGHCRGDGPHVRGCWVVDGVLGKS